MEQYIATQFKRIGREQRSCNLYAGDWEIVERHEFASEDGARKFVTEQVAAARIRNPLHNPKLVWEITKKEEQKTQCLGK